MPLTTWPHKKPHTTTPGRRRLCGPTQTLIELRVRRCSRPLCSSQRTTRHPPHDPAKPITTPQGRQWYEIQAGPDMRRNEPRGHPGTPVTREPRSPGAVRSLRTQQRAYEPNPHPDSAPRTPRKACRTRSPQRGPAELVSVPPSSTVPNTRSPSRRGTVMVRAQLWTTRTSLAASAP